MNGCLKKYFDCVTLEFNYVYFFYWDVVIEFIVNLNCSEFFILKLLFTRLCAASVPVGHLLQWKKKIVGYI